MNFTNAKLITGGLFSLALLAASVPAHGQGFLFGEVDSANNNQTEVYYRGSDSNIYQIVVGANTWTPATGPKSAGKGPAVAANTGIFVHNNTAYRGNEVFYFTVYRQSPVRSLQPREERRSTSTTRLPTTSAGPTTCSISAPTMRST
jgi:hypothetical protein